MFGQRTLIAPVMDTYHTYRILIILLFLHAVQTVVALNAAESCFCQLRDEVDDCSCKVESVDSFNNLKVFPRINSLLTKNYFRYWKVNLNKGCQFWSDDSQCALKGCQIEGCSEDQLPNGLRNNESNQRHKYSEEANDKKSCDDDNSTLGELDTTLSEERRQAFKDWKNYDDAQHTFCELDDDTSADCNYVDLLLNPERYTGYKGDSPHRIWNSIYNENCFQPEKISYANFMSQGKGSHEDELCLEKRAFHRMISGLHTSINIHLSAMYYFEDKLGIGPGKWAPNLKEFQSRFNSESTNGMGPRWLKNLYFTYLVELRALAKAAPYLEKETYYTGDAEEDKETKEAVIQLLQVVKSFEDHFDESKLFQGDSTEASQLKEEFKLKFRNISRIMDCVGCDKCRLWGKLQVTGMGTALKILFSGDDIGPQSTLTQSHKHKEGESHFQLRRLEIIALFNAFGRLCKSIHEVEQFRIMMNV